MKLLNKAPIAALIIAATMSLPARASTTIAVDLWDAGPDMTMVSNMKMMGGMNMNMAMAPMKIKLSVARIPAGEITFNAVNSSKNLEHEMVIAMPKDLSKGLPYKANSGRVDENAPGMDIGEIAELEPGEKHSLTINLEPGTYILYCNVPGHYASGMWTKLVVE